MILESKKKIKKNRKRRKQEKIFSQPAKSDIKNLKKERPLPITGTIMPSKERDLLRAKDSGDVVKYNTDAVESGRTKWQHGEWEGLVELGLVDLSYHPNRGTLALLVAAGHFHLGNRDLARYYTSLAIDLGCNRSLICQVLISGVYNTLGRLSVCINCDDSAKRHFETAIKLVEPRVDTVSLARTRHLREIVKMGLLPDAARFMERNLAEAKAVPAEHSTRLAILETELELLNHELSLSLQKGQLFSIGSIDDAEQDAGSPDATSKVLRRKSVSQLGQDLWVLERSNYKRNGYFVEFGATDGVLLSNTWMLEKEFGWSGMCAEPNPKFFEKLNNNRRCTVSPACISGETGREVEFLMADEYGGFVEYAGSDMHKEKRANYLAENQVQRLTTVSLHDFLVEHGAPRDIDYLSIDTEGSEYEILAAFPFEEWNVRLITVEHNFSPLRDKICMLLISKGYVRMKEAQWDDWYELKKR